MSRSDVLKPAAVYCLIAVHLAVALPLAYHLNIWSDEASTLYATENGLLNAIRTSAAEQRQAPLYFWILSVWRYIDASPFFARLFSILCSVLSIKLFAGLCQRLFASRTALLVTAFFALHPLLFWASLEIRVYAMVILLTLVLIKGFYRTFFDDVGPAGGARRYGLFLGAMIVSLYANYYLGFVIAGLFVALIVTRKWREAAKFAVMSAVAAAAFAPLLFEVRSELLVKRGGYQPEKDIVTGLQLLWNNLLTFLWPTEIFPGEVPTAFSTARGWAMRVLAAVFAIAAALSWRKLGVRTLAVGAAAGTMCALFVAAYFLVGPSYVIIRHATVLFVPVVLAVALILSDVLSGSSRLSVRAMQGAAAAVLAASFVYSLSALYPAGVKRGDWARVASYIEQHEAPGQPIIVFTTFDALALRYHYRGPNVILPDERYFDFQAPEGPPGTPGHLSLETQFVISEIPAEAEQIWLTVNQKCLAGLSCTILQNHIESNYTIEAEKEFYLGKVYLLRKRPR